MGCVYGEKDGFGGRIRFKEDEVELVVDRVGKIYSLNNGIYIGRGGGICVGE